MTDPKARERAQRLAEQYLRAHISDHTTITAEQINALAQLLLQVQAEGRREVAIEIATDLEDMNVAPLAAIAADIRKNYAQQAGAEGGKR